MLAAEGPNQRQRSAERTKYAGTTTVAAGDMPYDPGGNSSGNSGFL